MTIHYQNKHGEEMMISGIVHLQNVDNENWVALTSNDKELCLKADRIEGIYHEDTKTVNITKKEGTGNGK